MSNAWSHLPNARHIDRVIASVQAHRDIWAAAYDVILSAAWDMTRNVAYDATYDAAWNMDKDMGWYAAWAMTQDAGDVILALIMYDDSAKYLDMTSDQLKTWAVLSEEPAAVLLLPAVVAYEKISELELI